MEQWAHYPILHVDRDWKVWKLTVGGSTLMVRIPMLLHPQEPRVGDVVSCWPPMSGIDGQEIERLVIGEKRIA
jgi:hypothetical protein